MKKVISSLIFVTSCYSTQAMLFGVDALSPENNFYYFTVFDFHPYWVGTLPIKMMKGPDAQLPVFISINSLPNMKNEAIDAPENGLCRLTGFIVYYSSNCLKKYPIIVDLMKANNNKIIIFNNNNFISLPVFGPLDCSYSMPIFTIGKGAFIPYTPSEKKQDENLDVIPTMQNVIKYLQKKLGSAT